MKWYTKYLQVYEQPFDSAPKEAVDFVFSSAIMKKSVC